MDYICQLLYIVHYVYILPYASSARGDVFLGWITQKKTEETGATSVKIPLDPWLLCETFQKTQMNILILFDSAFLHLVVDLNLKLRAEQPVCWVNLLWVNKDLRWKV